jgi:hypothetical protein
VGGNGVRELSGLGDGKRFNAEDGELGAQRPRRKAKRDPSAGLKQSRQLRMTMLVASSEVREENQGDAYGDQEGAKKEDEA